MYQNNPALPANTLPTMYDLPSENAEEMGLPDKFHDLQPRLLSETCLPTAEDFFIGIDLNLYYDVKHTGWYKRPDWFLVLGTSDSKFQAELRLSYVVWQEGLTPFLMVELLSPGTESEDLGQTLRVVGKPPTKWQVYEQILRVPYYAVFDRYSNQFRMFCLQGIKYVELAISGQGFWFDALELGLGVRTGVYKGVEGQWLCWYDAVGNWVLSEGERIVKAEQRADLLAAKLRELGVDVD